MPKSSKKRKDKAADFAKAKLRLGKGKQVASNAVDTSFKARSIALPAQSIAFDKDAETPTTKRRLTFSDLTAHLKHYNAGTRRDAILGLRELMEGHPGLIGLNLTALVNSCVRLIGDEDASVRKTLLSFFGWLLRQVPPDDLVPHSPALLLFTTSAQTHIFPEIRIDAIRFLDVFLEYIPDIVIEGWAHNGGGHGRRVLEGYMGVLNAGTSFGEGADSGPAQATSTASIVLSPGSKLVVLESLSSFLSHALSVPRIARSCIASTSSVLSPQIPTWYLSSSFSSPEAFRSFDSILRPVYHTSAQSTHTDFSRSSGQWIEEVDLEAQFEHFPGTFGFAADPIGMGSTIQDFANIDFQDASHSNGGMSADHVYIAHLAQTLHSTLVSTFLDCAPTVFSPSSGPPETELRMISVIGEICRSLYGAILQEPSESGNARYTAMEDLKSILGYFAPYFPFEPGGSSMAKRDIKVEQAFQDLNLTFCELTALLMLASPESADVSHPQLRSRRGKGQRHAPRTATTAPTSTSPLLQVSRVSKYIVQLLRGEAPSGPSQTSLARPLTPAAYSALLPTTWSLLNGHSRNHMTGQDQTPSSVLRAVIEHAIHVSSGSVVKRVSVDFIGRLILLEREAEYQGAFRVGRSAEEDSKLEEWVLSLPKTLWELGANNLSTTETILRFLLRLHQRRSPLLREETLSSLRARLVPYFVINHATRGKLPGPFAKLPTSPLRGLVLDVMATICGPSSGSDALETAVDEAVRNSEEEVYWTSVKKSIHR
ncbi:hypothetical protein AcV5_004663 [Taiwanofungus camphoratus]|nr:hypothetical protein AcW2_000735 [Antrodia cinnamomea]KAI0936560.1 hypothetical protein AcV5_004663 [Antrodia cinnamomea]KAI0961775.1 hypothetical protein AcV7_000783 [Antrodia cinnamomea]